MCTAWKWKFPGLSWLWNMTFLKRQAMADFAWRTAASRLPEGSGYR